MILNMLWILLIRQIFIPCQNLGDKFWQIASHKTADDSSMKICRDNFDEKIQGNLGLLLELDQNLVCAILLRPQSYSSH